MRKYALLLLMVLACSTTAWGALMSVPQPRLVGLPLITSPTGGVLGLALVRTGSLIPPVNGGLIYPVPGISQRLALSQPRILPLSYGTIGHLVPRTPRLLVPISTPLLVPRLGQDGPLIHAESRHIVVSFSNGGTSNGAVSYDWSNLVSE